MKKLATIETAAPSDNPSLDPVLRVFAKLLPNLSVKAFPCHPQLGLTQVFTFRPTKASDMLWTLLENEFIKLGVMLLPRDKLRGGAFAVYSLDCKTLSNSKFSQGVVNGEEGLILLG